jgi:hypothetical protein
MALPKQEQIELIGKILDFLLEESKKPPDKVKPIEIPGLEGQSELIEAVAAILENPSLYINKETLSAFEESLEISQEERQALEEKADTVHVGGKKFQVEGKGRVLNKPLDYILDQLSKMEATRKEEEAAWAGSKMKAFTGLVWARQNNLDEETQETMIGVLEGDLEEESKMKRRSTLPDDTSGLRMRSERLCDKYLSPRGKQLTLNEFRAKNPEIKTWDEARNKWEKYKEWRRKYQRAQYNGDQKVLNEFYYNRNIYTFLEKLKNFEKSSGYRSMGNFQEADKYMKVRKYIDKYYKAQKGEVDIGKLNKLAGRVGQLQGMYGSLRNAYGEDFVPDFLTGKFFSAQNKKDWLRPSRRAVFQRKGIGVNFYAPKKSMNKHQSRYFQEMNKMYYLSPITWVRTLTTGEMFAFLGYQTEQKYKQKILSQIENFNWNRFLEDLQRGDYSYFRSVEARLNSKQKELIEEFLKKDSRFSSFAISFSTLSRLRGQIEEFLNNKLLNDLRNSAGTFLLSKFQDASSRATIKSWMLKGGVLKPIKGLTMEFSSEMGIDMGSFFDILNDAYSKVKDKFPSLSSQLFAYDIALGVQTAALIVIGAFLAFLIGGASYYNTIYAQFTHVIPQEVVTCGTDGSQPIQSPIDQGPTDFTQPTGDSQFHQVFNKIAAEMGLVDVSFFLVNPGDYWYERMPSWAACVSVSSGEIYCKEDYLNGISTQAGQNMIRHELVHQAQFRNGVYREYETLFMEWGADYLTNNGGNYLFVTEDGQRFRATQTPIPEQCDSATLEAIAYGDPSTLNSACFQALQTVVHDFAF